MGVDARIDRVHALIDELGDWKLTRQTDDTDRTLSAKSVRELVSGATTVGKIALITISILPSAVTETSKRFLGEVIPFDDF